MKYLTIAPVYKNKLRISANSWCEDGTIISNPLGTNDQIVINYDENAWIKLRRNAQGSIDIYAPLSIKPNEYANFHKIRNRAPVFYYLDKWEEER